MLYKSERKNSATVPMGAERPVLCFRSSAFYSLSGEDLAEPLDKLDLSVRASKALGNAGVRSVGQLVDQANRGLESPRSVGETTFAEIHKALRQLSQSAQVDGSVDWTHYRKIGKPAGSNSHAGRPSTLETFRLHSESLDHLAPAARAQPLGMLHLTTRPSNCLNRRGIHSIGAFVDSLRAGLDKLPSLGRGSLQQIGASYQALSSSVKETGEIDWVGYALRREFSVLPDREESSISTSNLAQALPDILTAAVGSTFSRDERYIFQSYLLPGAPDRMSSADATKEFNYTRQGISIIRKKILRTLREAVFADDYTGCRFRFRDSFTLPLRRLRDALAQTDGKVISYAQWERVLWKNSGLEPEQLGASEEALLLLLDYQAFRPTNRRGAAIIAANGECVSPLTEALSLTKVLLRKTFPDGLSRKQLLEHLRSAGHHVPLRRSEFFRIIRTTLPVEEIGPEGNVLRVRTGSLPRLTDQVERILRGRGTSMSGSELKEEISRFAERRSTPNVVNLRKTLGTDARFKHIGRTGVWALREWEHVDCRTAMEIAAELFRASGKPMTEAELHQLISSKRPIKFGSLASLLRDDGRFRRVGPRTWELKANLSRPLKRARPGPGAVKLAI